MTFSPATVIASRQWIRKLPAGHRLLNSRYSGRITANAQLYSLGDQAPRFSLTGEVETSQRRNHPVIMGGCIHEEILAFWPNLKPLADIHLSTEDGVPMHAVANGAYWLGFTQWKTGDVRKSPNKGLETVTLPYMPYFRDLWRITDDETRTAYYYARSHSGLESPQEALEVLYLAMLPRWKDDAIAAIAILRGDS